MAGSPLRSCRPDGTWSGNVTTCNSKYFYFIDIDEIPIFLLVPKIRFVFFVLRSEDTIILSFKYEDIDFVMLAAMRKFSFNSSEIEFDL